MAIASVMRIQLDPGQPFNLGITLCCGQVFRWKRHGKWWFGITGDKVFKIRQTGSELLFENVEPNCVSDYFRLDDDLRNIHSHINKDKHIGQTLKTFKGLRIVKQDPWECLISYICATCKNIPAIEHMLHKLARKLGEKAIIDGLDFWTFPTPEHLARATSEDLKECGLGYRAKYVAETARKVLETDMDLERLRNLACEEAKIELMRFPGVGTKVADCVLLFSLGKLDAFPVDVWVKRAIEQHYADHFPKEFIAKIAGERSPTSSEYRTLNAFGRRYFGEFAGYAQQYLYHYERTQG